MENKRKFDMTSMSPGAKKSKTTKCMLTHCVKKRNFGEGGFCRRHANENLFREVWLELSREIFDKFGKDGVEKVYTFTKNCWETTEGLNELTSWKSVVKDYVAKEIQGDETGKLDPETVETPEIKQSELSFELNTVELNTVEDVTLEELETLFGEPKKETDGDLNIDLSEIFNF